MPLVIAPSPGPGHWPSPSAHPPRIGRDVVLAALPGAPVVQQWLLKRNCSVTPRQMAQVYGSLCLVSLLISGFFLYLGAPFVLAFAGLEMLALGLAMLVFARHATDCETLTLMGRTLQVVQQDGGRYRQTELAADWLTVEPVAGQGSLVKLSSHGLTLRVGRFLRPELLACLAQELRSAVRQRSALVQSPSGLVQSPSAPDHGPSAPAISETDQN